MALEKKGKCITVKALLAGAAIVGMMGSGCDGGASSAAAPGRQPNASVASDVAQTRTPSEGVPFVPNAPQEQALARYGQLPNLTRLAPAQRALAALAMDGVVRGATAHGAPAVHPEHLQLTSLRPQPGRTEATVRQVVGRIPVYGSHARVVLDEAGEVTEYDGQLAQGVEDIDVTPVVTSAEAIQRAADEVHCTSCGETAATWLFVLPFKDSGRLAWRVWPGRQGDTMVFVDAHSGEVLSTCSRQSDRACFDELDAPKHP